MRKHRPPIKTLKASQSSAVLHSSTKATSIHLIFLSIDQSLIQCLFSKRSLAFFVYDICSMYTLEWICLLAQETHTFNDDIKKWFHLNIIITKSVRKISVNVTPHVKSGDIAHFSLVRYWAFYLVFSNFVHNAQWILTFRPS